jgi:DnaJ domain
MIDNNFIFRLLITLTLLLHTIHSYSLFPSQTRASSSHSVLKRYRHLHPRLSPRRPLRCTEAVSTPDTIEPARYRSDLYGVLGVSKNSTLKELKQSYWNIALNNHPDRNDSIEALYIFQNASHAYNILGKHTYTDISCKYSLCLL